MRVVEYIYDAWGKLISTTGTLATTLGADNPFRYRGYYYDTETGLYYLTTRYYDPEVCRFISADVYMSTGQGVLGDNILDGWVLATISGAATGLLATSGLGVAGQAIGNAIISAGTNIYQQSQSGGSFDWLEFGIETTLGLASGFAGGKGVLSKSKGSGITNMAYNLLEDLSFGPTSSKIRDRLISSAKISGIVTGVKSTLSGIYKKIKKGKAATCSKSFTRNKLNNSHMLLDYIK